MKKHLHALLAALILAFASIPAMAVPVFGNPLLTGNNTTFSFSAQCTDCESQLPGIPSPNGPTPVTGTLILQDYALGTPINLLNFVSFSYAGPSNHITPFTVGWSPDILIIEALGNLSGEGFVQDSFFLDWLDVSSGFQYFLAEQGQWELFINNSNIGGGLTSLSSFSGPSDFGTDPSFITVPEPSSLALLGLGLAGLAFAYSRKRKAQGLPTVA